MTDPTGETPQLARLRAAERLAAAGQVPDAEWRRVVETFPREEFAPGLWVARGAAWAYLDGSDDADRAEWLREVYAGGPMVVALADATRLDGPERLYSGRVEVATVPVARYLAALHALNPRPGHRILELGLGAGIGAGMIAHHLAPYRRSSDPPVVAVEVDPDLAETAAKRLARLGYAVQVHTGDALAADLPEGLSSHSRRTARGPWCVRSQGAGAPSAWVWPWEGPQRRERACHGPRARREFEDRPERLGAAGECFDRLIATFPVPGVPATWLALLAPGGRLVVQLGDPARLLVLDKASDGTGVGVLLREDRPGAYPVGASADGWLHIVGGPGPVQSVRPYPQSPAPRKDASS